MSTSSPSPNPIATAAAFAAFYDRHAEDLLVYFTRRVPEPEVSMDLTAETFAQALTARRRFRGESEPEAAGWLYAIARNQLANFVRKGRAEKRAMAKVGIDPPELTQEAHDRIVELAEIDAQREALSEALAVLSRQQREALDLRVVQELPYEQVASRLGVSAETARARVSRGLARLAASIDPDLDPQRSRP